MFTRLTIPALLAVVALSAAPRGARGQSYGADPTARHWPLSKISFPVDLERVMAANPRPVSLRFYARTSLRGKFDLIADKKVNELDEIEDLNSRAKKRGFHYTSAADGRVDFALQYVYANGDTSPATPALTAQYKIVFDTRQPLARIVNTGPRSVRWSIEDENLVPTNVRLEVRSAGGTAWTTVTTREFGPKDSYTWAPFDRGRVLEVRAVGKDQAGHEGVSNVVRISGDGGDVRQPDPLPSPGGPLPGGRIDTGFGGPDDFPSRPQIEYVNNRRLIVRSKPTRVTRSGIAQAVLWMKEQTGQWHAVETNNAVNITLDDTDKEIAIPYEAKTDGLFNFIIQPINGAGQKPDDPRDGDPAHWVVEVDTTPPKVTYKGAKAVPGGLTGPRVEIDYAVVEKNPMPDPITIEYTTDPKPTDKTAWLPIASKVPNTGKYVWEIEPRDVWKFHLRVTAEDRAKNVGTAATTEMVTVDLEKPAAEIKQIDTVGPGGGPKRNNFRPDGEPETIRPSGPLPVPPAPPKQDPPKGLPLPPPPVPKPDPKKPAKPPAKSKTSADLPDVLPSPTAVPAIAAPPVELPPIPGGPPSLPPVPGAPGG